MGVEELLTIVSRNIRGFQVCFQDREPLSRGMSCWLRSPPMRRLRRRWLREKWTFMRVIYYDADSVGDTAISKSVKVMKSIIIVYRSLRIRTFQAQDKSLLWSLSGTLPSSGAPNILEKSIQTLMRSINRDGWHVKCPTVPQVITILIGLKYKHGIRVVCSFLGTFIYCCRDTCINVNWPLVTNIRDWHGRIFKTQLLRMMGRDLALRG